ncbi:MAG: DUF3575 domain-containing protein [Candidatus Methanomethylophilaceae archaeon]|nr:DUF3575 domain-containing protein [Candidatus Methanomethylophilaceae archaeon]MBR6881398.1 DUF3575 domain-containing protein [Bacteroidales bacterium]
MKKALMCLIAVAAVLLSGATSARAQAEFAVSTNAVEWFVRGGINAGAHLSFSRHWSVDADALYRFGKKGIFETGRELQAYAGARWWPWSSFSGLYVGSGFKHERWLDEYLLTYKDRTRTGMSLRLGYAILLHQHFNLEIGAAVWGGIEETYDEGNDVRVKNGWFRDLDNFRIGLMYVF